MIHRVPLLADDNTRIYLLRSSGSSADSPEKIFHEDGMSQVLLLLPLI
jgi:hypothetical protein